MFFPEGAYGPTNNCVGIGDVLRRRGHEVVFIVEESFAGTLESKGFAERLMRLTSAPEVEEAPGQFWKDFIRETAPIFRRPTIEQLEGFIRPTWQALCNGAKYVEPRLREILAELINLNKTVFSFMCGESFPSLALSAAAAYGRCGPARVTLKRSFLRFE